MQCHTTRYLILTRLPRGSPHRSCKSSNNNSSSCARHNWRPRPPLRLSKNRPGTPLPDPRHPARPPRPRRPRPRRRRRPRPHLLRQRRPPSRQTQTSGTLPISAQKWWRPRLKCAPTAVTCRRAYSCFSCSVTTDCPRRRVVRSSGFIRTLSYCIATACGRRRPILLGARATRRFAT